MRRKTNFSELCNILNKCANRPRHGVSEWQQIFWNWTSSIKRKAREIFVQRHLTGGGSGPEKFLTDLESTVFQLLGELCVQGMAVHELGIINEVN